MPLSICRQNQLTRRDFNIERSQQKIGGFTFFSPNFRLSMSASIFIFQYGQNPGLQINTIDTVGDNKLGRTLKHP